MKGQEEEGRGRKREGRRRRKEREEEGGEEWEGGRRDGKCGDQTNSSALWFFQERMMTSLLKKQ